MNVHQAVKHMDKFLATEDKWSGKVYALDKHGELTHDTSIAMKLCLVGAFNRISVNMQEYDTLWPAIHKAFHEQGVEEHFLSIFNDNHTFKEIKDMMRKVIDATAP